jgi:hypothetical protein
MNLLKETLYILEQNNKSEKDILWIGNLQFKITWENFKQIADVEYDSGYGSSQVAQDLLIVGNGWWLERGEYDGSEWWSYKETPRMPNGTITISSLTVSQSDKLGFDVSCGWETLARLNNLQEQE